MPVFNPLYRRRRKQIWSTGYVETSSLLICLKVWLWGGDLCKKEVRTIECRARVELG